MQCVIGVILAVGSLVMPESPRYGSTTIVSYNTLITFLRWLIDTDQDAAGMRVIVDLHGGDPNDILAQAEFQEIKEKVVSEVSVPMAMPYLCYNSVICSACTWRGSHVFDHVEKVQTPCLACNVVSSFCSTGML